MAATLSSAAKRHRDSVPDLTRLKRIMRHETGVTVKWYDIGVELLSGNTVALDEIQAKYSSDVNKYCTEMFKTWLQHNPEANWDQLASALSEVGLNTAAENIKTYMQQTDESSSETITDGEADYIEKELNARTVNVLRRRYANIIVNICNIFKGKNLDINSLILTLAALDNDKITIFSTDEALKRIHSIDELFIHISYYCSIYDYDLLTDLVKSTNYQEAVTLLDDFTEELNASILSDLDLLCENRELRDPNDFMPGTHKLVIKYIGGKCTMKIEKLVRSIICERFHLKKGSIFFKGVQPGSVNFIYQISAAVKAYIQQYPITAEKILSEKDKIKCLIIDDEEVKFPEAEFTVVLTGITGSGRSAACSFYTQKHIFEPKQLLLSASKVTESRVATIDGKRVELIDAPGFLDPTSVEKDDKSLEFAIALINMMSQRGFHVLGLVHNITKRIEPAEDKVFKNLLSIYEHYLPYTVMIFTHGKYLGSTEEEQKTKLQGMIKGMEKTSNFCQILEKINYRYIILESVDPMEREYHAKKSKELVKMIEIIFRRTRKRATNEFASSFAEHIKKYNVDQQVLIEELADRIKIAIRAMMTAESEADFFKFLVQAMIDGSGILATVGRAISKIRDYASTAYDYASTAYDYASTAYDYASTVYDYASSVVKWPFQ